MSSPSGSKKGLVAGVVIVIVLALGVLILVIRGSNASSGTVDETPKQMSAGARSKGGKTARP